MASIENPDERRDEKGAEADRKGTAAVGRKKHGLRRRALGALTFVYGSADHRNLPDDERRRTGAAGEDVGDGWHRHGDVGRQYVTRDDDPQG